MKLLLPLALWVYPAPFGSGKLLMMYRVNSVQVHISLLWYSSDCKKTRGCRRTRHPRELHGNGAGLRVMAARDRAIIEVALAFGLNFTPPHPYLSG